MSHHSELPKADTAPVEARQLLTEWVGNELTPEELDSAKLICSELVTNAFLHGEGSIALQVDLDENRLIIEVIDEGKGFEHEVREIPFEEISGRGLTIVDAVASRWGIHEGTTHVWAELDRPTHVWVELERPGPRLGEDAKPDE